MRNFKRERERSIKLGPEAPGILGILGGDPRSWEGSKRVPDKRNIRTRSPAGKPVPAEGTARRGGNRFQTGSKQGPSPAPDPSQGSSKGGRNRVRKGEASPRWSSPPAGIRGLFCEAYARSPGQ